MEDKDLTWLHNECYKGKIARLVNKKVKKKEFVEGSLVLQWIKGPRKVRPKGKLIVSWEGLHMVKENLVNGVYRLETIKGNYIPHTCNAIHLKAYYVQV